jgi:hypothetical protein
MAYYACLGSAPSAYPHVSYSSYLHPENANNSTDARFSTDDRSLSGDGIPNFKARITDLEAGVKDIKTGVKDIKTEVNNMIYYIVVLAGCIFGGYVGTVGGTWLSAYHIDKKWRRKRN